MSRTASETLALMDRLRAGGKEFCVATIVRTADATSAKAGAKAVVTADGVLHGFIGGGCVTGAVRRQGLEALAEGAPRIIRVKPKDSVVAPVDTDGIALHPSSCPSGGTVDIFLEPMRQAPRLVICGASPVATALATLSAAMGYRTVVAAPAGDRPALPDVAEAHDGYELSALALTGRDAVVVATQGRRDREALTAALLSEAGYVAMVGSRRKLATLLGQLGPEVPEAARARLHGPAGLDLGAIEPEEIALSILAEIVRERRRPAETAAPPAAAGGVD